MSTTILDFRVREEMAGAVLKEVAALEPAERLKEADSLTQIMEQALHGLEELWEQIRQPLELGISLSDAAALARVLTRSANLIGSSLELLVGKTTSLEKFKETSMARVQRIKARAASLQRLVEIPAPALDPERLRRSLEQIEKGDGVDAEEFLAQLKG